MAAPKVIGDPKVSLMLNTSEGSEASLLRGTRKKDKHLVKD